VTTLAEAPTEHPGRAGVRLRPALAVLLGGALLVGLCLALPAGRRQLQLSFTQVSEPYTEIFFTAAPVLAAPAPDGSRVVDVSFAVREHNGRGNPIPFEARALTVEFHTGRGGTRPTRGSRSTRDRPGPTPWPFRRSPLHRPAFFLRGPVR